jgi:hypothetical protein
VVTRGGAVQLRDAVNRQRFIRRAASAARLIAPHERLRGPTVAAPSTFHSQKIRLTANRFDAATKPKRASAWPTTATFPGTTASTEPPSPAVKAAHPSWVHRQSSSRRPLQC